MVLAPEHPLVADLTTSQQADRGRRVPQGGGRGQGHRPAGRRAGQDRRVHRLVRHQPGHRRRHPDLDRRLRADGLRHRGDHGRAVRRPARLRVRHDLRARHPGDPAAARRVVRRAPHRADARHPPLARGVRRRRPVRQLVATARSRLDGISSVDEGIATINAWLESNGCGEATITYKLRDWLFTRQRYWGEPIPIVYDDDGNPHVLPDEMLPLDAARHRQLRAAVVRPRRRVLRAGEPARPPRPTG